MRSVLLNSGSKRSLTRSARRTLSESLRACARMPRRLPSPARRKGLALLEAIREHDAARVAELIPVADLTVTVHNKMNALMLAVIEGQPEIARLLLPHVDPKARAANHIDALCVAVMYRQMECVELLLPHSDHCPDFKQGHGSALNIAARTGQTDMVRALLAFFDPAAFRDTRLGTILTAVVFGGHLECFDLLLPLCDPFFTTGENETLLMDAAYMGHLPIVKRLAFILDPEAVNSAGHTAEEIARNNGKTECADFLHALAEQTRADREVAALVGDIEAAALATPGSAPRPARKTRAL